MSITAKIPKALQDEARLFPRQTAGCMALPDELSVALTTEAFPQAQKCPGFDHCGRQ